MCVVGYNAMPSQRRVRLAIVAVVAIVFLFFYYSVRIIASVPRGLGRDSMDWKIFEEMNANK